METSARSGHAARFAWVVVALSALWAITVIAGPTDNAAPAAKGSAAIASISPDPPITSRAAALGADDDPRLPTPEAVPAPEVVRPVSVLGRIQIPTIGLDANLFDQITTASIDLGPSHWPGSAPIGGIGNAIIAGHRVTHSAPFHDLDRLRAGDPITLMDSGGTAYTYTVTESFVVSPDSLWITDQTPERTLTLFTCHPLHSAEQRLVIRAALTS